MKQQKDLDIQELINNNWQEITTITGLAISLINGPIGAIICTAGGYNLAKKHQQKQKDEIKKETQKANK